MKKVKLSQVMPQIKDEVIGDVNLDALFENIFILHYRRTNDYPRFVKPQNWGALQSDGEIASGVMIIEGDKTLVVAPSETEEPIPWSSADISGGGTTTSNITAAINDWNGKSNTASLIAASTPSVITNTTDYAPGFCNLYTRPNANGQGLTAGKWWLPSVGELSMIYANILRINYAGSFIAGFEPILAIPHWTSTEYSTSLAWDFGFDSGTLFRNSKSSVQRTVRPVSALQF